jgi:hypothetical protein
VSDDACKNPSIVVPGKKDKYSQSCVNGHLYMLKINTKTFKDDKESGYLYNDLKKNKYRF